MNQEKIGKFIAQRRKHKGWTQAKLAEKLNITDRAVSKWETGRGLPDFSIMPELCSLLDISMNELLSGELIEMENYNRKAEEILLEMARKEEQQNEKMMVYEWVIGLLSVAAFLALIATAALAVEVLTVRILLIVIALAIFIVGISFALKIEAETGYYECGKCHHKYVPQYKNVYFAMHWGTTRFLKCPACRRRSWNKKVLKK